MMFSRESAADTSVMIITAHNHRDIDDICAGHRNNDATTVM